jgi:Transposase DDE domain
MQSFERQVCQRLPLADSVFRLLDFCTEEGFLDDVFDRHRGRSYQDILTFPQFVRVISDTLLGRQRSAQQHFQDAQDAGTLPTCVEALYGKLRRVPLTLSQGLLGEATCRLRQVFPNATDPLPASLDALEVVAFDGKKIKFVAKRLKALRVVRGQILGGKLLVAQHVATGLAVAIQAAADGEASDNSLVSGAVAQVRQHTPDKTHLWVGDRAFCDLKQIPVLKAEGDHFLLRYHPKTHFHRDEKRTVQTGVDSRGVPYTEEWGWLGAADNPQRQYVRRITLHRPGQEAILVVTDLLDGVVYPAADVLETYRRRWGIEKMFQRVTEVFDLRHLIGSTPQATVFQAAFCFLLSNVIQTIRSYVAQTQECQPEEISTRLLFEDVVEELTAWHKFLSVAQTVEWLEDGLTTAEQMMAYLRERLAPTWKARWRKAKAKKPPKEKPPTRYLHGGHSSVYRIQRNLHEFSSDPDQTNQ